MFSFRIHSRKSDLKRKSIFHSMKSNNLEKPNKRSSQEISKSNRADGKLWPQVPVGLFKIDLCCSSHSKIKTFPFVTGRASTEGFEGWALAFAFGFLSGRFSQQSFATGPFLPQWLHLFGSGQFSAKWPFFPQLKRVLSLTSGFCKGCVTWIEPMSPWTLVLI